MPGKFNRRQMLKTVFGALAALPALPVIAQQLKSFAAAFRPKRNTVLPGTLSLFVDAHDSRCCTYVYDSWSRPIMEIDHSGKVCTYIYYSPAAGRSAGHADTG